MLAEPLLAVNVDTIIEIGVFLVVIVGWVLKLIANQANKGPPVANRPRPPARPRDEQLQNEIDVFIQETGGRKPVRKPQPRPAPVAKSGAGRRGQAPLDPRRAAPAAPQPKSRRVRPGQELSERQAPVSGNLGTGVEQHLKQYMADKVSQEVASHLRHSVDESVSQHLGTARSAAAPAPAPSESAAPLAGTRLAEMFRNRDSLRQAMIVNLILSPPPGRVPRRSP